MDENKATAAEETLALKNEAEAALTETRRLQNEHLSGFKKDLTEATEKLYKKLADDKTAQEEAIEGLEGQLTTAKTSPRLPRSCTRSSLTTKPLRRKLLRDSRVSSPLLRLTLRLLSLMPRSSLAPV